jgi:hypothetical protein
LAELERAQAEDAVARDYLTRKVTLLRFLSYNNYAGISKEAKFVDGWDIMSVLPSPSAEKVKGLWEQCLPLRKLLAKYHELQFPKSTDREPWLQSHVFIPLLRLLKEAGNKFRLHGNCARLYRSHNKTYSQPDASLTHRHQFAVDLTTCGPIFELEYTISEANVFDKQNHFLNGQGQVLMYLVTEALGPCRRPFYLGFLTDCCQLVSYQLLDSDLQFYRSTSLPLLTPDLEEPPAGFVALVALFETDPEALGLPSPAIAMQSIEGFVGFPHIVEVPKFLGAKKDMVTLQFNGVLGFGVSSFACQGRWQGQDDVCIKIGVPSRDSAADGERCKVSQISHEITILPLLAGIPGIPTVLWSRDLMTPSLLSKVLVTAEVGVLLHSDTDLQIVYGLLKHTLTAAHARGICHHDVSPTNIILVENKAGPGSTPILIDWGLASKVGHHSRGFSGNPLFSSRRYDAACSASPFAPYRYTAMDDLESLIYSICYVNHRLPWADLQVDLARMENKAKSSVEQVCGKLEFLVAELQMARA